MKIELIKEEIGIINDLVFREFLEMNKIRNNKYIDTKQVDTMIEKLKRILDVVSLDKQLQK